MPVMTVMLWLATTTTSCPHMHVSGEVLSAHILVKMPYQSDLEQQQFKLISSSTVILWYGLLMVADTTLLALHHSSLCFSFVPETQRTEDLNSHTQIFNQAP